MDLAIAEWYRVYIDIGDSLPPAEGTDIIFIRGGMT